LHRDVALRVSTLPGMEPTAAASAALDEERGFRQRKRSSSSSGTGTGTGSRRLDRGTGESSGVVKLPDEPASSTVMIDVELETTEAPGAADAEFREGTIVADRYRLVRRLGKGGMAQVFEARDLDLGETVAVKLHDSVMASADLEMRFKREVTLSRSFAHPNIIRVYDIGRIRGHKYLTMELLSGNDLEQTMKQKGVLEAREAVGFLLQICAGLGSAHELGAVHRDIKPANFFVHQGTVIKLTDFGIARDTRQASRTGPGLIMGTPEYMAPEQFKNFSGVTASADLYSVGIMAYRMMAGDIPFRAAEFTQMAYLHVVQPPAPPRQKNPALSEEFQAIILKLLEKQPAARFASCRELAAALSALNLG
jgi:serine/threonine-protein kinase